MKEISMESAQRNRLWKACGICSKNCPAQINIPEALEIYKEYLSGDMGILEKLDKMESSGKPVDCIECGACSAHCPNGVDVKEPVRQLAMMQSCRRLIFLIDGGATSSYFYGPLKPEKAGT